LNNTDNIKYLLHPESIALLGCSENNMLGSVLRNLQRNGFVGKIYPVHPKHTSVFGVKCYPSLDTIPGEVDVCVVGLRSALVLSAIEEMHKKDIKAAVIFASGFAENGLEGKELQKKIHKILAKSLLKVVKTPPSAYLFHHALQ